MASLITRGKTYYIQWCVGQKIKRKSLKTTSHQMAKEKLRQFESARVRGEHSPLPTRTPLPEILARYVEHVRAVKTPKSAQTDIYYLRQMFGPICPALQITSRRASFAGGIEHEAAVTALDTKDVGRRVLRALTPTI